MARLWTFAAGLNSLTAGHEFTSGNGSGALSLSAFPSAAGRVAVRINPSAASAWFGQIHKSSATNVQVWVRTVLEVGTLPSSTTEFVGLWNSGAGTRQAGCYIDSSGAVHLRDSTANNRISSSALSAGIHVIEFTTTVSAGSAAMELVIDGVSVGTYAFGNTSTFDACYWGTPSGAGTYDLYVSEMAINDGSGSNQTSWPSTKNASTAARTRIAYIRPSAQGDNNAWLKQGGGGGSSTNYQDVDEVTPDDATTYLKRTSTGAKVDDYNLPTAASVGIGASDTITLIQVGARVGSTSTTATGRNYATRIKSQASGTVQTGSTATCNVSGWVTHSQALPRNYQLTSYVDPQAGGAWTPSLIDSAQIGFTTVTSSANEIRVSTLWAIIEHVVGVTVVNAAATLDASGTIDATSSVTVKPAVAFGSTGTLAATALNTVPSAAALSGAGTLAAAATDTVPVIAALSGDGTLTATATVTAPPVLAAAALDGSGTLTAAAEVTVLASAVLAGGADLAVSAEVAASAAASLNAAGMLTAAVSPIDTPAAAGLSGSGDLAAVAEVEVTGAALLSSTAGLAAFATDTVASAAALNGSGTLAAAASPIVVHAGATLSGAATLSVTGLVETSGAAELSGTGTLACAVSPMDIPAAAALSGAGTLTGSATIDGDEAQTVYAAASVQSSGQMEATASVDVIGGVVFTTNPQIAASAAVLVAAAAALTGSGTVVGSARARVLAAALFSASGAISGIAGVAELGSISTAVRAITEVVLAEMLAASVEIGEVGAANAVTDVVEVPV